MQTDHRARTPPAEIDEKKDKAAWWDHSMNTKFLPATAAKYDCGLVDVRARWDDYLKAHKLEPKALLKDDIHLNAHGNFVMGSVVSRYLVHRPELKEDQRLFKEIKIGPDEWKEGRIKVKFDGNRVDVVSESMFGRAGAPTLTARIDGKKPSEFPGCYSATRTFPGPWSKLFLMRVGRDAPPVKERWTLWVTYVEDGGKKWAFKVDNSYTGDDGEGVSDKPFVSKSKRLTIDPAHWFPNGGPVKGTQIQWAVEQTAEDWVSPSHWQPIRVAQGLPNGSHTLILSGTEDALVHVHAIRVYRPPFPKPKE